MRVRDLTGMVSYDLTVVGRASSNRQGSATWLCRCICGREVVFSSDHLTRKKCPVKSCGCKVNRRGEDHPQWSGCGEISGDWWYSHVLRERKQSVRERVPVSVTLEEAWNLFLQQGRRCALSGVELQISPTGRYNTASIDRIDSSLGYTLDNIQWVHKDVNFMKRTYSVEYFLLMCQRIVGHSVENSSMPIT